MRRTRLVFILLSLFFFNSCGDGLSSTPELSAKVFEALKAQDFAMLIKLMPNKKDVEVAAKLYEGGKYSKDEWEQLAESKLEALLLQANIDFKKIMQDLQDKGFDIKHAVLKDSRYQGSQTIDNYNVSAVELVLKSGASQCIIQYNAMTIRNRWFMDRGMKVMNIAN